MSNKAFFRQMEQLGIVGLPQEFYTPQAAHKLIAMDSAGSLEPNAGVPAYLTAVIDPEVFKVLSRPLAAEQIFGGPVKKGSFGVGSVVFEVNEETGDVSAYSDFGEGANSDSQSNWPAVKEYRFSTTTQWGDLQQIQFGMANIDAAQRKQVASANTLKRAHNRFWLFGVEGVNTGALNNPDVPAPLAVTSLSAMDADALYDLVGVTLFGRLVDQTDGLVASGINEGTALRLVLSNKVSPLLKRKNSFGVSVAAMLKEAFPNLEVVIVPEYSLASGELIQMLPVDLEGYKVGMMGYSELLHAHGPVRKTSSWQEKKSAGNFGAIIAYPFAIASVLGAN